MTDRPAFARNLHALFEPSSVVVVGSMSEPSQWGYAVAEAILSAGADRPVHLVSRSAESALGQPVHSAVADIPGGAELALLAVPVANLVESVDEVLAAGAKGIVALTAGVGEKGAAGKAIEADLAARVRAAGAVLVGPNCLGIIDSGSRLNGAAYFGSVSPGGVGIISQSGNLGTDISLGAQRHGSGISRFVSLGNQSDVTAAELLVDYAEDPETLVVTLYIEDFRDGRQFLEGARYARSLGKQVILLAPGASESSRRAAQSHTGSMLASRDIVAVAAEDVGVVLVESMRELVDVAIACMVPAPLRGRRLGIVADGGGNSVVGADILTKRGLVVPELSACLVSQIAEFLSPLATAQNPIDTAGVWDLGVYPRVVDALFASDEVDAVLIAGYFGSYGAGLDELRVLEEEVARELLATAAQAEKPLYFAVRDSSTEPMAILRGGGATVFDDMGAAVTTIAYLATMTGRPKRPPHDPKAGPREEQGQDDTYWPSRHVIASAGIRLAQAMSALRDWDAIAGAAATIGYPVVLKALGTLHKSDVGGVAVNLHDPDELLAAFSDMNDRLAPQDFVVEAMAPLSEGVELIVGAKRDPSFGPIVMVGFGGVFSEVVHDIALALAPVSPQRAEALILQLKAAPLLTGARGRAPLDVGAAANAVAQLSTILDSGPEIMEVEVNPLLVTAIGAVGLDARVIWRERAVG